MRTLSLDRAASGAEVRRVRLVLVEGERPGASWESSGERCAIGAAELNDVVLADPAVSRFHCELRIDAQGARVRDLGSRNGTVLDGVEVVEAFLRDGSLLRVGKSALRVELGSDRYALPVSKATRFGELAGVSAAMRATFGLLERAASSDVTVLLVGETGTGKTQAAEGVHRASARRKGPFVVVDCSAIPTNLLESELFGHERGAFTGAEARRIGALEEAAGGTLFLDEIGEVPPEVQPKLLRAIETKQVRRVGSNTFHPVDARIVAATQRDLRAEVNAGRFRADLYYRLAVATIALPPLRHRPEDIPVIVEQMLGRLRADPERAEAVRAPEFIARLQRAAWPGNGRELRNYLERYLVFEHALEPDAGAAPTGADASQPYAAARRQALATFERGYLEALLARTRGNVATAAALAGINRVYFYKLLRRHGLSRK